DPHLDAIAVKLDLMDPVAGSRRALDAPAELWRDEVGHRPGGGRLAVARRPPGRRFGRGLGPALLAAIGGGPLAAVPLGIGCEDVLLHHERLWRTPLPARDRLHLATGSDGGVGLEDGVAIAFHGVPVAVLDQQPVR